MCSWRRCGCNISSRDVLITFASSGTREMPKEKLKTQGKPRKRRQPKTKKPQPQASDVRPSSDVRHQRTRGRPWKTEALVRTTDVRQTADVRSVGRPTDNERPKPP